MERTGERTGEGTCINSDLHYNQQHWQDRSDSFQWVIGSLVAQLDSVPT
jgi:hypothetical protein